MRLVFMYGGGADGSAGWPSEMAAEGYVFMERVANAAGDDPRRDTDRLVRIARNGPVHLVGVSYGGIAAVLAAQQVPSQVRSLTLFEPSCADLAREAASVRSFRQALEPVMRQQNDPSVTDGAFLAAFLAATGESAPGADRTQGVAKRLRATPPPWEITIPRGRLRVPTLVLTGGWSDYFEDIAQALVQEGAAHRILSGCGHWVPGHPKAAATLREFASSNE